MNDFEDIKQVALLGLWKGILTFDNKRNFSTYACTCIINEINYYLRKKRKNNKNISIETKIGEKIKLSDILRDKKDEFYLSEMKIEIRNNMKNLTKKEQIVLIGILNGKTQKEIGKELGLTQASISRIFKRIKEKLYSKDEYI